MTDRSRPGDDDESTDPAAVTVPPWLRTGPAPEPAVPPAAAPEGPAAGAAPVSSEPVPPAEPEGRRIRLDSDAPEPEPAPQARLRPARGPLPARARLALLAAAGVVVLAGSAVLGFALVRGADGSGPAPAEASGSASTSGSSVSCPAVDEPGHVAGNGPGSPDTAAGAVLAFDHAYYVDRSAARAFEHVAPSSRMSEESLRVDGVDRLPEGTTHCVDIRELSPTLLDVTLTEFRPEAEPVHIRQRVRVAEAEDGTWGIVSITPAG